MSVIGTALGASVEKCEIKSQPVTTHLKKVHSRGREGKGARRGRIYRGKFPLYCGEDVLIRARGGPPLHQHTQGRSFTLRIEENYNGRVKFILVRDKDGIYIESRTRYVCTFHEGSEGYMKATGG
ncbi:hypothetical protein Naga_100104g25 [Nannochloropsis gaditana]|uniref:Uncharacterized protein n=1 Tax=Nannochloropsis gaditana TaxID=72520 RepID=W7TKR4_9STRA|nr:hypothetical protein Naga_100104g25 [Nannochloropsis gaditana]